MIQAIDNRARVVSTRPPNSPGHVYAHNGKKPIPISKCLSIASFATHEKQLHKYNIVSPSTSMSNQASASLAVLQLTINLTIEKTYIVTLMHRSAKYQTPPSAVDLL